MACSSGLGLFRCCGRAFPGCGCVGFSGFSARRRAHDGVRGLAVFCDDGQWLRGLLRPGFRHCFAAVVEGETWVTANIRQGRLVLDTAAPWSCDLAAFYRGEGFSVAEVSAPSKLGYWALVEPSTCVGLTKRILGVHAPLVWTPYQLYRFLGGQA